MAVAVQRLYFTGNDEADALLAAEPFALLVGFALDQQVTVPTAFSGPLKLKQRIGTLDPGKIAATDPASARGLPREAGDSPFPRRDGRARAAARAAGRGGVRRRCLAPLERGGRRRRSAQAHRRASRLRRDEDQGVRLGSRQALRGRGRAGARPDHPTLGDVDSPQALERYQAAKRAYKAKLRAQG